MQSMPHLQKYRQFSIIHQITYNLGELFEQNAHWVT